MKAIITIEVIGAPSKSIQSLAVEAPTLDMLKTNMTRTCLLQIPDLITHAFEVASKTPPDTNIEKENASDSSSASASNKSSKTNNKVKIDTE